MTQTRGVNAGWLQRRGRHSAGNLLGCIRECRLLYGRRMARRTLVVTGGVQRSRLALCQFLPVEVTDDSGNVSLGLIIRWNSVVLLDALRTSVVSRKGFYQVKVVALKQFSQISSAALNVSARIKRINHSQAGSGLRHQLHQT